MHTQSLGQVGRVVKVQANSDVRVAVNGRRWIMNPRCMVPAPNQTPQEDFLGESAWDTTCTLQHNSSCMHDCSSPKTALVHV